MSSTHRIDDVLGIMKGVKGRKRGELVGFAVQHFGWWRCAYG